jgi:hypothetical protein
MLDISLGQFVLLTGVAYYLLGPKELIRGARLAGVVLGKAVVRIQKQRDQLTMLMSDQSMSSLHPELRRGFANFMSIQNEVRSATINPVQSVQQLVMMRSAEGAQNASSSHPGGVIGGVYVPRLASPTGGATVATPAASAATASESPAGTAYAGPTLAFTPGLAGGGAVNGAYVPRAIVASSAAPALAAATGAATATATAAAAPAASAARAEAPRPPQSAFMDGADIVLGSVEMRKLVLSARSAGWRHEPAPRPASV